MYLEEKSVVITWHLRETAGLAQLSLFALRQVPHAAAADCKKHRAPLQVVQLHTRTDLQDDLTFRSIQIQTAQLPLRDPACSSWKCQGALRQA